MRYLTITFIILLHTLAGLRAQDTDITAAVYQTVNVRSGPGTQYEIIGQLNDGDIVPVLGRDSAASRWLYVPLLDGSSQGWVAFFTVTLNDTPENVPIIESSDQSTPVPAAEGVHVTAYGRVNVRSGPAITYDVVGQLESGDTAQVTARSNYRNDWLYIQHESHTGWIAYFTVSVRGNPDDLPVRVLDSTTGELVPPTAFIRSNYQVHLHARPALRSRIIGMIPFDTEVIPLAVTANGRWLYVSQEDVEGWAWAELFDITEEQIALIPHQTSE